MSILGMGDVGMNVIGIRFRLHPLFALVAFASVITGQFAELAVLFCIVLIHELGHVAAATGFGWKVREVQLLPFGGVAVVEQRGVPPLWQELAVSLAGPLQNGIMMLASALLMELGVWSGPWGHFFLQANMLIALFNLLPVLPLDGGKVMQAFLDLMLPYYRSLTAGAWISLAMSAFIVLWSVWRAGSSGIQLNLLMIGIFLLYSNWMGLKHIPYQFVKFLAFRLHETEDPGRRQGSFSPVIVPSRSSVHDLLHLIRRNRHQLFYLVTPSGMPERVLSEKSVLRRFFSMDNNGDAQSRPFM